MKVTWIRACIVLGAAILHPAVTTVAHEEAKQPMTEAQSDYRNAAAPIEDRIRDLLGRMTPEEKARQMDMYAGAAVLSDGAYDTTKAAGTGRGLQIVSDDHNTTDPDVTD